MDVGVFVELEQVGVAEFTHMGSVVYDPLRALVFMINIDKGLCINP